MKYVVGQEIISQERYMTQEIIDKWASLSGDYNPIHVDLDFAKNTRFKGTIAHGHISLSYLCGVMLAWAGNDWAYTGKLLNIRFVAPVCPGRQIIVGGIVTDTVKAGQGKTSVHCKVFVRDAEGNRDCVVGDAIFEHDGNY